MLAALGLAEDPLCMYAALLELLPVLSLLEDFEASAFRFYGNFITQE